MVAGGTVHPYGPRDSWASKLRRVIAQTAAMRAPAGIPIDVTEYGLSSSGGDELSDNYGWPTDMTYAQAAAALRQTVAGIRGDRAIPRAPTAVPALLRIRPAGSRRDRRPRGLLRRAAAGPVGKGRLHARGAPALPLEPGADGEPPAFASALNSAKSRWFWSA